MRSISSFLQRLRWYFSRCFPRTFSYFYCVLTDLKIISFISILTAGSVPLWKSRLSIGLVLFVNTLDEDLAEGIRISS